MDYVNRRLLVVFSCALLVAVCISYVVYRMMNGQALAGAAKPSAQVVLAARDLEIGTLIQEADVKSGSWPGPLPKRVTLQLASSLNRGVISKIYEGEPVTEDRLAATGSGAGLAATIPAGMRACAVKVNDVVGLAGFVIPGMRVDVLITGVPPGATSLNGPEVRTLLQNIRVLSAGMNFQEDSKGKPMPAQVVNLLVTPDQAEILSLASEAHIQLVLRNPMDAEISKPPGTMMAELYGGLRTQAPAESPESQAVRPPRRAPMKPVRASAPVAENLAFTIEVFNGSARTKTQFERIAEKP